MGRRVPIPQLLVAHGFRGTTEAIRIELETALSRAGVPQVVAEQVPVVKRSFAGLGAPGAPHAGRSLVVIDHDQTDALAGGLVIQLPAQRPQIGRPAVRGVDDDQSPVAARPRGIPDCPLLHHVRRDFWHRGLGGGGTGERDEQERQETMMPHGTRLPQLP